MRLEMGTFPVTDIVFGRTTRYDGGRLTVDRDAVLAAVRQDPRIASAELEIAKPGESVRIWPVRDVIEPRIKVEGPGVCYPGICGREIATVGEGRTHRLSGMGVVEVSSVNWHDAGGDYVETYLDMSGPYGQMYPYQKLVNLCLVVEPDATLNEEVKFDVRKFNWLGSQEKGQMMLYIRADSPYKSIDDIIKAKEPPKCGGSGPSDQTALLTRLLEETVGAKFVRVLGYKGGSEVDVAMERGEVTCRATRITVHFSREPFLTWEKKGFDRHLMQAGTKRDSRLGDVPTIFELMDKYKTSEVGRRLARVILAGDELGRPMVAPPGVPADRVKILRDAYNKSLRDPDLVAEVNRSKLDMESSTGEEIQSLYKELMTQPREVIERVKKIDEN